VAVGLGVVLLAVVAAFTYRAREQLEAGWNPAAYRQKHFKSRGLQIGGPSTNLGDIGESGDGYIDVTNRLDPAHPMSPSSSQPLGSSQPLSYTQINEGDGGFHVVKNQRTARAVDPTNASTEDRAKTNAAAFSAAETMAAATAALERYSARRLESSAAAVQPVDNAAGGGGGGSANGGGFAMAKKRAPRQLPKAGDSRPALPSFALVKRPNQPGGPSPRTNRFSTNW
jgi:hypothetical protein